MYRLPLDPLQLLHPLPDIGPLGIKLLPLQQRVEDAEIRLRVHARRGAEAPPAIVGRKVAVDEMFHEIALAPAPVDQQVLGQEGRDGHAGAVVHVAGVVELAHGGVDEGVARRAGAPLLEELVVVLPLDVGVFGLEGFVHADVRPVGQDVLVEIPPGDFGDPADDPLVASVELPRGIGVPRGCYRGPCAERSGSEVDADNCRAVARGIVSRFCVLLDFLGKEFA